MIGKPRFWFVPVWMAVTIQLFADEPNLGVSGHAAQIKAQAKAANSFPETLSFNGKVGEFEVSASLLKLGEIYAGQSHAWEVKFRNQSGQGVAITSAKACCGSNLEYLKDVNVPPGAESTFIVHLLKQSSPGRYGNTVHLTVNGSIAWPINIEAFFISPFKITPARVELLKEAGEVTLSVQRVDTTKPVRRFELKPQAGVLRIVTSEFNDTNGVLKLQLAPTRQTVDSVGVKLESFDVLDIEHGQLLVSLPFAVKLPPRIIHRPSTISLRKNDGIATGSGILIGTPELLSAIDGPGTISVWDRRTNGVVFGGEYEIKSSNGRNVVLEYTFRNVISTRDERESLSATLHRPNGDVICTVSEILLPE